MLNEIIARMHARRMNATARWIRSHSGVWTVSTEQDRDVIEAAAVEILYQLRGKYSEQDRREQRRRKGARGTARVTDAKFVRPPSPQ